jgi:WD40 repeat protein
MALPEVEIERMQEFAGHRGSIFALAADAAGRFLYSSGDDGVVVRWDLADPELPGLALLRWERSIYSLALAGEDLLAAGASDGTLYLLSLSEQRLLFTFRKTSEPIYGLHYEAERGFLWILYGRGSLSLLALPSFEERGFLRVSTEHLRAAAAGPEGRFLYLGASDGHIYRLDTREGGKPQRWQAHDSSVFSLLLMPDGGLLSGGRDAQLCRWYLGEEPPRRLERLPAHYFTLNHLCASPDGGHFLSASRDKTWKLWEYPSLRLLKVVDAARQGGHRHSVNKITWLHSDNSVISCSDDRRIIRWRIQILDRGE